MIAAAHKSSGKTVVSVGLAAAFRARGKDIQTFKKGPDYIDPMWLSAAGERPCYNLDFNTMSPDEISVLFTSRSGSFSLIEANKGLFDGVDVNGSDSNAELAKILQAPVVLVVDTTGTTRGIAPLLLGYQAFDADVNIAGVILNKTGGTRHEGKLRAAVETHTDIPVVGAVGKNPGLDIGERHLGLTTPAESGQLAEKIAGFGEIVGGSVDLDRLVGLAGHAPTLPVKKVNPTAIPVPDLKIGIAQDTAFGFYYPDDLEAFANTGATLVPIDTMHDTSLAKIDGLFIGGGFPETQMRQLSANKSLRLDIKAAIENGLPTYAECGGLMYLCNSLSWKDEHLPMVGVVDGDAVMCERPQGRGYAKYSTNPSHPWDEINGSQPAHEFHYARIDNLGKETVYGRSITRGHGIDGENDAIVVHNLLAGFCHLRNTDNNPWVQRFVDFVRRNRR